jgi:hypothetical protein
VYLGKSFEKEPSKKIVEEQSIKEVKPVDNN